MIEIRHEESLIGDNLVFLKVFNGGEHNRTADHCNMVDLQRLQKQVAEAIISAKEIEKKREKLKETAKHRVEVMAISSIITGYYAMGQNSAMDIAERIIAAGYRKGTD